MISLSLLFFNDYFCIRGFFTIHIKTTTHWCRSSQVRKDSNKKGRNSTVLSVGVSSSTSGNRIF